MVKIKNPPPVSDGDESRWPSQSDQAFRRFTDDTILSKMADIEKQFRNATDEEIEGIISSYKSQRNTNRDRRFRDLPPGYAFFRHQTNPETVRLKELKRII